MDVRNGFSRLLDKTTLYCTLASYYEFINPEMHHYYGQKYRACVQQLVQYVNQYGDPFEQMQGTAGGWSQMQTGGWFPGTVPAGGNYYPGMAPQRNYHVPPSYPYRAYRSEGAAKLRFLHASPDAPAVDLYANGQLMASNLAFKKLTDYANVPVGTYKVDVYPTGKKDKTLIDFHLAVEHGKMYTAAVVGKMAQLEALPIEEDPVPVQGKTKIRVIHLSPDAPTVDVAVKNGNVLFTGVSFKDVTPYIAVTSLTVDLCVRLTGTKKTVLDIPSMKLKQDEVISMTAVGMAEDSPELALLLM